jgi:hypothetical protein
MNSFCAAANLRTFVQSTRCPDMIGKCEPILKSVYGEDTRGTLMNDIRTLDRNINPISNEDTVTKIDFDREKLRCLDVETYKALVAFVNTENGVGWTPSKNVVLHNHYTIGGLQYRRSTSGKKNSTIFFQPEVGGPLVPGVIRQIFSLPRVSTGGNETSGILLAVQRYKSIKDRGRIHDPFSKFMDFGAGLWDEATSEIEIIMPSQRICHAIWRKWEDKILVMRPLNRVSHFHLKVEGKT